jgi:hypothetical protein
MTKPYRTIRPNTFEIDATATVADAITANETTRTGRPPYLSVRNPTNGCDSPFISQPMAAAREIAAVDTPQSSSQVFTKTPKPCREPIAKNDAKNRAAITYQP